MHADFVISRGAYEVVATLQDSGFETYIVGGAIRDLLLERKPKDFDISTSATPEEVRHVFGRREARIIGKRFRLAHVTINNELFEVSTFRRTPQHNNAPASSGHNFHDLPENMIVSDNSYGSSQEDAFRRDFTVNALFYDPVKHDLIDHTGRGIEDIEKRIVRAIGDPLLRFEEDPVRMLRALKLVAQFDFSLDSDTENALFASLPLLQHASSGRLSLELEKILKSSYCDRHFEVFFDYGLLPYFLPELSEVWGSEPCRQLIELLYERNCRVDAGIYRDSISLALAASAYPFVIKELDTLSKDNFNPLSDEVFDIFNRVVSRIFAPQTLMIKVREAAIRILQMQFLLENSDIRMLPDLMRRKSYAHGRELLMIRHLAAGENITDLEDRFPAGKSPGVSASSIHRKNRDRKNFKPNKKRNFHRKKGRPESPPDFDE
ncbi:MAG: polynucleotide adenylyltransferase PcnB [Lentisphaeria bacterium]|nr:polynucleotide adenylyltransferase PcnB [Lentisphaeria bacterium]